MKVTINVGDVSMLVDSRLATEAGWVGYADGTTSDRNPYAYRRLARALSEGFKPGDAAVMRAIALGEEESRASRAEASRERAAAAEQKAAELRLEVAKLESMASGRA